MSYKTKSHYETEEEMVTCENCGNCWDGFAQCSCNGISIEEPAMDNRRRTHTMTLRSHTEKLRVEKKREKVKATEQINEPIIHPECWNEHTHYGQCGQSCPCCRAMVGDEWGACLVCSKKY